MRASGEGWEVGVRGEWWVVSGERRVDERVRFGGGGRGSDDK
jgi:hypothetical protein